MRLPSCGGGHLNEFTHDGEAGACLARAFLRCVSVSLRGWILLCMSNSREIYLKDQASVCVLL